MVEMGKWVRCTSDECAGGGDAQAMDALVKNEQVVEMHMWWRCASGRNAQVTNAHLVEMHRQWMHK